MGNLKDPFCQCGHRKSRHSEADQGCSFCVACSGFREMSCSLCSQKPVLYVGSGGWSVYTGPLTTYYCDCVTRRGLSYSLLEEAPPWLDSGSSMGKRLFYFVGGFRNQHEVDDDGESGCSAFVDVSDSPDRTYGLSLSRIQIQAPPSRRKAGSRCCAEPIDGDVEGVPVCSVHRSILESEIAEARIYCRCGARSHVFQNANPKWPWSIRRPEIWWCPACRAGVPRAKVREGFECEVLVTRWVDKKSSRSGSSQGLVPAGVIECGEPAVFEIDHRRCCSTHVNLCEEGFLNAAAEAEDEESAPSTHDISREGDSVPAVALNRFRLIA